MCYYMQLHTSPEVCKKSYLWWGLSYPVGETPMTNSNISKFSRLVMGVAVAALIAASCGSDESDVVEPVEPVTVETTTAPTTAPALAVDVEEPATSEDADPTVDQDEAPATSTTAADLDPTEDVAIEETPPADIEDEPADELVPDDSDTETENTDAPVDGIASKALAFLASDLGVPESEIALTGTEQVVWPDASLGCPQEGYAYAQVEIPGFRFTFLHGTSAHDVHTDEMGTHIVRPVECYGPTSSDEPAVEPEEATEESPEPAGEPEEASQPEEDPAPEQEPVSGPAAETESSDAIVCPRNTDGSIACPQTIPDDYQCESNDDGMTCRPPGVGSQPEQEPETEPETVQQPEQATSGDIECSRNADGTVACPRDVPDDYWCENTDDGMICHPPDTPKPEPEILVVAEEDDWTPPEAGMVPEVHPDVPLYEWQSSGWQRPDERINDTPRPTAMVVGWTNWCYNNWPRGGCNAMLHDMKQALDYLGAHQQCVLNMYTEKVKYLVAQGAGANWSYATNSLGWHLCATVIDPIVFDIPAEGRDNDAGLRLSDTPGITLAERCRIVLTIPFPDIQLEAATSSYNVEAGIPTTRFGQDCNAWASWIIENGQTPSSPACNESLSLAEEWMEHHHNQHERYFSPDC